MDQSLILIKVRILWEAEQVWALAVTLESAKWEGDRQMPVYSDIQASFMFQGTSKMDTINENHITRTCGGEGFFQGSQSWRILTWNLRIVSLLSTQEQLAYMTIVKPLLNQLHLKVHTTMVYMDGCATCVCVYTDTLSTLKMRYLYANLE